MDFDREFREQNRRINSQMRWEKARMIFTGIWKAGILTGAGALIFLLGRAMQTW